MPIIIFNDGTNGGGGVPGSQITANGINGDGSVATPIVLGGKPLNQNTIIPLAGFDLTLGTGNNVISINDTPNTTSLFAGNGTAQAAVLLVATSAQVDFNNGVGTDTNLLLDASQAEVSFDNGTVSTSIAMGAGDIDLFWTNGPVTGEVALQVLGLLLSFTTAAGSQEISFSLTGGFMTVLDTINSKGLQYSADYSAVGSLDPRWIPDNAYVESLVNAGSVNRASNKVAGSSANTTLITYTIPTGTPTMYRVSSVPNFRSGVGTVTTQAVWTDTSGTVNTKTLATASAVGSVGALPLDIYALNGTNILINSIFTGTAVADIASLIQFLI